MEDAKWYVVNTYSGYENMVMASIQKTVEIRQMQHLILDMNIPVETVTEKSGTETKTVERKVYPGYLLIKMIMSDDSWHLVRSTRGVTGFIGSTIGPVPLTEEEIVTMGVERHEIVVAYKVGDTVKITDGPLSGFFGTVEELDTGRDLVRVVVSMFGRETPVDLELDQVEAGSEK